MIEPTPIAVLAARERAGWRPQYVVVVGRGGSLDHTEEGRVYLTVEGKRCIRAVIGESELPLFPGEYRVLVWTLQDRHPIWGRK